MESSPGSTTGSTPGAATGSTMSASDPPAQSTLLFATTNRGKVTELRALVEERLFAATEPFSARDARIARDGDALVVALGATVRKLRIA